MAYIASQSTATVTPAAAKAAVITAAVRVAAAMHRRPRDFDRGEGKSLGRPASWERRYDELVSVLDRARRQYAQLATPEEVAEVAEEVRWIIRKNWTVSLDLSNNEDKTKAADPSLRTAVLQTAEQMHAAHLARRR